LWFGSFRPFCKAHARLLHQQITVGAAAYFWRQKWIGSGRAGWTPGFGRGYGRDELLPGIMLLKVQYNQPNYYSSSYRFFLFHGDRVCFLAFLLLHHLYYVLCIKLFSLVLFSTNQMYQVCIQDSRDICL
jgi:hypothetical protein